MKHGVHQMTVIGGRLLGRDSMSGNGFQDELPIGTQ